MSGQSNHSDTTHRIPRPGDLVKARIVRAGIRLSVLAEEAGYTRGTMSDLLSGRNRSARGQRRVLEAFRAMTGTRVRADRFWGDLTNPDLEQERIPA